MLVYRTKQSASAFLSRFCRVPEDGAPGEMKARTHNHSFWLSVSPTSLYSNDFFTPVLYGTLAEENGDLVVRCRFTPNGFATASFALLLCVTGIAEICIIGYALELLHSGHLRHGFSALLALLVFPAFDLLVYAVFKAAMYLDRFQRERMLKHLEEVVEAGNREVVVG